MQKDLTAGPDVYARVELPELPEGTPVEFRVELRPRTEEEAKQVIAAFGGIEQWGSFSFSIAYLLRDESLSVAMFLPKREDPHHEDPFAAELEAERRATIQAEADVA